MNLGFLFDLDCNNRYPKFPYNPTEAFLEFNSIINEYDKNNLIYQKIRSLFLHNKYDKKNIGTKHWNPFRGLVEKNQIVVIKPNLVLEERGALIGSNCITTNASVIRPILDYLYILQLIDNIKFKVVIGDIPLQSANFNKIIEQTGIKYLVEYYKRKFNFNLELLDLRQEIAIKDRYGFIEKRIKLSGDYLGYTKVHLNMSFFDEIIKDYKKFSIGDYDLKETKNKHKQIGEHYYLIPNTVLYADLFINIPKIKTHQKAGVTISLKNLIGINGDKSWLPHYRKGAPRFGGDEFSDDKFILKYINSKIRRLLQGKSKFFWIITKSINNKFIKNYFLKDRSGNKINQNRNEVLTSKKKMIMDGAWYGNNTLWRSILDLNYLLFFADKKGKIKETQQRNYLTLGEGIVAAEGNGPLNPKPRQNGLITLSDNPIIHDVCCSRLMGFDWKKIPQLRHSTELSNYFGFDGDVRKIEISGAYNTQIFQKYHFKELPNLNFLPSPGWLDHIEI